ncbi:MAG TPA: hypothetical protein VMH24_07175, partial [Candidatus Sulfotelmatobacter sp.]|nr:hypothetical protein [Candidatus Sulfotelmatobacter sp.]
MKHSGIGRALAALTTVVVIASACSSGATTAPATSGTGATPTPGAATPTPAGSTSATGPFTIGYSNGAGVGNGFREEQVCTAKAEATALGPSKIVSPITIIHRNTDAA